MPDTSASSISRLTGNFRPRHALIVSQLLAHLDYLDETIAQISQVV